MLTDGLGLPITTGTLTSILFCSCSVLLVIRTSASMTGPLVKNSSKLSGLSIDHETYCLISGSQETARDTLGRYPS
jgi:hypothetical protein